MCNLKDENIETVTLYDRRKCLFLLRSNIVGFCGTERVDCIVHHLVKVNLFACFSFIQ